MKTGYAVADAMTTKPVTALPTMTIVQAAVVMRDADVGSLLIADESQQLLGILTAEDVVYRVTAQAIDPTLTAVAAVMTRDVVDIAPEADIYDAVVLMREHDIFHLPVRDEHKRLVGFLTLKDVLRIEPQLFELMAEMAEIRPRKRPLGEGLTRREGYCEECGNYADELERVGGKSLCGVCLSGDDE